MANFKKVDTASFNFNFNWPYLTYLATNYKNHCIIKIVCMKPMHKKRSVADP